MQRLLRHRPSPAMVVACVSLAIGLGGVSYAAGVVPGANTVGTKQLKKNAVTGKKIKKNAVTGAKVKNDSLNGADILESSLAKVPSATNADNATTAGNAGTLDGLDSPIYLPRAWSQDSFPAFSTQTAYTTIASGAFTAPTSCNLILNVTVDWDDNGNGNVLFTQWFVDGVAVGGDFAFQGGATGLNYAASAIASKVVAAGAHTIEYKARVTSGSADLEDLGANAFCAVRDGAGAPLAAAAVAPARSRSSSPKADRTQ